MKNIEKYLDEIAPFWNLISGGSVDITVRVDKKDAVALSIHNDHVNVNIMGMDAIKIALPLLMKKEGAFAGITERSMSLSSFLQMLGRVKTLADKLAAMKKYVTIAYRGKEILRVGHGARSFGLSVLNYDNIQIGGKMNILRFINDLKDVIR